MKTPWNLSGYNGTLSTIKDIYPTNIDRAVVAAEVYCGVASASANDAESGPGTGAHRVLIEGVNGSYARVSEVVILTGQTKAVTVNKYRWINRFEIIKAGTGLVNAGIVYIADTSDTFTAGVPQTAAKIMGQIAAGDTDMGCAAYMVPAGEELVIEKVDGQFMDATTTVKYASVQIEATNYATSFKRLIRVGSMSTTSGGMPLWPQNKRALVFPEKTLVKFRGTAAAACVALIWAEGYLVDR